VMKRRRRSRMMMMMMSMTIKTDVYSRRPPP